MARVAVEFRRCVADQSPARDLLAAVLAEFDVQAGHRLEGGPLTTREDFEPPDGAYLVGYVDGAAPVAAACGRSATAWPRSSGCTSSRRCGAAVSPARCSARSRMPHATSGTRRTRLDCRNAVWPLYRGAGYREIADYNDNPHAQVWAEKKL